MMKKLLSIVTYLAQILKSKASPIDDLTIDEFIERLQQALIKAPYSREVRELKAFAQQQSDPEYLRVYHQKRELNREYLHDNQPDSLFERFAHSAETLVYDKLKRYLSGNSLGTVLTLVVVLFVWEFGKSWWTQKAQNPAAISEELPFQLSFDSNEEKFDETNAFFNAWLSEKLAEAVNEPEFRDTIVKEIEATISKKLQEIRPAEKEKLSRGSNVAPGIDFINDQNDEIKIAIGDSKPVKPTTIQATDYTVKSNVEIKGLGKSKRKELKREVAPNSVVDISTESSRMFDVNGLSHPITSIVASANVDSMTQMFDGLSLEPFQPALDLINSWKSFDPPIDLSIDALSKELVGLIRFLVLRQSGGSEVPDKTKEAVQ